jgi:hypothetical protein
VEEETGLAVEVPAPYEEAVRRTRLALRANGFSILSEMPGPVGIGEGVGRRHLLMGLWESLIAAGNLGGQFLDVGDHLSISVVVFEEGEKVFVAALDPAEGLEGWSDEGLAATARAALESALNQAAAPSWP